MPEAVNEKVIRLEVQMANITLEIAEVKSLVKEVIIKVDNVANLQSEITNLKVAFAQLEKVQKNRWVLPLVVGAVVSILAPIITLLVVSYLNTLR